MEQNSSWEANNHSASQIPHLLWNPKVHDCVQQESATGPYLKKTVE
jgi:hypothetical protein